MSSVSIKTESEILEGWSPMIKRSLTAAVLISVGIGVIIFGSWPLLAWILLCAIIVCYELFSMMKKKGHSPYQVIGFGLITLLILSAYFEGQIHFWTSVPVKLLVVAILFLSVGELSLKRLWVPASSFWATIKMVLFVGFTITFIYLVREGQNGFTNLMFGCFIIWTSDSVALFAGKAFGKTRLTKLSPKKTVEGSVAAVVGSLLMGVVLIKLLNLEPMIYLSLAVVISIVSQIADLHESLTKRHFEVKDSSNLLPGHGGFYDRADGYLLVMPILFYLFNG